MKPPAYETLLIDIDARGVARLTLNRPDTHNALNATLISELRQAAGWLTSAPGLRAVVLTGAGKSFCAGGDLGWMQQNMKKTRAERVAESSELALMLREQSLGASMSERRGQLELETADDGLTIEV